MANKDEQAIGPLKASTVFPMLVLYLINKQADHGYGLMERIGKLCGELILVNTNKIYPLLRELEEEGLLSAAWDHPTKRSRRIYSITRTGKARLAKLKTSMLPYFHNIEGSLRKLRKFIKNT